MKEIKISRDYGEWIADGSYGEVFKMRIEGSATFVRILLVLCVSSLTPLFSVLSKRHFRDLIFTRFVMVNSCS